MNRFWKFLGIFGSICSIIGLYLAFFFYNQTKETREPFFIESPIKSKLIETKNIEKAPFKIYRYDNTEINNDVTSTTLYLWNQGKKPIKSTDILDSLLISLPDSCEILKIEIIGQTRDVCNISLIQINKNQVKLNFNIIEHLDGFIAQLIYIGNSNQNLSISGNIEGVKNFNTSTNKNNQLKKILLTIFISISIFFIVVIALRFLLKVIDKREISYSEIIKIFFKAKMKDIILATFLFILINLSIFVLIDGSKLFSNKVEDIVPIEIKDILKKNSA